tara:strand:+ start:76 stop:384 length:309 start_codon:yes stop_codon:yes gene_type:complete
MRITFPAKLSGETLTLTFNFISRCAAAETISSASVVATVYSGTDTSPQSIVSGSPTISGQTVTQKITAGTEGVTYYLLCSATTSTSQVLQLGGYLTIAPKTE